MSELADGQFVTFGISAILQVVSGRRQSADTIPSDAMVHFRDEIARLLDANTRAVYSQALKNFKDFRIMIELPDKWPVPSEHILLYIAYHSSKGSAASTVSSYIAGISYIHKQRQWRDPSDLFIVKKSLEGLRRLKRTKDLRAPISEELLIKVCSALHDDCFSEYKLFCLRPFFPWHFTVF